MILLWFPGWDIPLGEIMVNEKEGTILSNIYLA